jgi:hypothetical protein
MHLGSKGDLPADIFAAKTGSEENEDQVKNSTFFNATLNRWLIIKNSPNVRNC